MTNIIRPELTTVSELKAGDLFVLDDDMAAFENIPADAFSYWPRHSLGCQVCVKDYSLDAQDLTIEGLTYLADRKVTRLHIG